MCFDRIWLKLVGVFVINGLITTNITSNFSCWTLNRDLNSSSDHNRQPFGPSFHLLCCTNIWLSQNSLFVSTFDNCFNKQSYIGNHSVFNMVLIFINCALLINFFQLSKKLFSLFILLLFEEANMFLRKMFIALFRSFLFCNFSTN